MWRLKSCPKCKGDVFIDRDYEGEWYEQCLQCSSHRYMPSVVDMQRDLVGQETVSTKKRGKRR